MRLCAVRLISVLILFYLGFILEKQSLPVAKKSVSLKTQAWTFDVSENDNSSKYFLQSYPIINIGSTETFRGPFYRAFLFLCILLAVGIRLNYISGPNISARHVLLAVMLLILFPFHSFP